MADKWVITGQRKTSIVNPAGGGFLDIYEVAFRITGTGLQSTVDVPAYEYGPDTVRAAVESEVEKMVAVHNL